LIFFHFIKIKSSNQYDIAICFYEPASCSASHKDYQQLEANEVEKEVKQNNREACTMA